MIVSVSKGLMAYLLIMEHSMTKRDVANAVYHVDVHYGLGSDRAYSALRAHGLRQLIDVEEVIGIDPKTVLTLNLG